MADIPFFHTTRPSEERNVPALFTPEVVVTSSTTLQEPRESIMLSPERYVKDWNIKPGSGDPAKMT